ncbi:MAG: hypothetical protein AAFU55_13275, partial [Pseudomonadota bacterium]
MCGIAGLIHKGKASNVGGEMTAMLQALKHRGPDSTGYAVYGEATEGDYVMRLKAAEAEDMNRGRGIHQVLADRIATDIPQMADVPRAERRETIAALVHAARSINMRANKSVERYCYAALM